MRLFWTNTQTLLSLQNKLALSLNRISNIFQSQIVQRNAYFKKILGLLLFSIVFVAFSFAPKDENILAKAKKHIEVILETSDVNLVRHSLEEVSSASNHAFRKGQLYELEIEGNRLGFAYIGEANSMKDVFDYLIVFDKDLRIIKSKVLIYREQHGQQIGSTRWLKQFVGMSTTDTPQLGKNIQGISGATISVTSMTDATRMVLSELEKLRINGYFSN